MVVIIQNHVNTTKDAVPQKVAKKYFFLKERTAPQAPRIAIKAKIGTRPIKNPLKNGYVVIIYIL
jgi:hypothetical protein